MRVARAWYPTKCKDVMESKSLKNKLTFVILGRSGCGKGTQAKFILRRLGKRNTQHLETGRFFREIMKKYDNPTVEIARKVMARGQIFPAWFSASTWLKLVVEKGIVRNHWVFDGAPRWLWEAKLIDEVMRWHGRPLPLCIYIDTSRKEATKRLLLRGRADDNFSAINNRMNFFMRLVLPTIRYYGEKKRLIRINGNMLPGKVWHELDRALAGRLGKRWP